MERNFWHVLELCSSLMFVIFVFNITFQPSIQLLVHDAELFCEVKTQI